MANFERYYNDTCCIFAAENMPNYYNKTCCIFSEKMPDYYNKTCCIFSENMPNFERYNETHSIVVYNESEIEEHGEVLTVEFK